VKVLPGGITSIDGLIISIDEARKRPGTMVAPGLIDIQINGGWGHDFTADPSSMWEVGARLPETGVTAFLPTIVSSPYATVEEAIEVLAAGPPAGYRGAIPIGLHVEGPWLSPRYSGAHEPEHLRSPDPGVARSWASSGVVRMVTIAPELENAFSTAETLTDAGVVVSAGHTAADFAVGSDALAGPWSAVTHLFNQMSPLHHRDPGMVGAALLSERPCLLIVDGFHIHPAVIDLAWRHLGPERTILVTDAMAAAGLGPGAYHLGNQEVVVGAGGPRIGEILAGSTLTMDRALANLGSYAKPGVAEAWAAATSTPAVALDMTERGRLEIGARADLVVLGPDLVVRQTFVGGDLVYDRDDRP
jgi:N-acetylglucosamine-6-phosphate deacetylase